MIADKESKFIFVGHNWFPKEQKVTFSYQVRHNGGEFEFTEILEFPQASQAGEIPEKLLKNVLDSLLLVLGISYYKLFCPRDLIMEGISLSQDQAEFWNTVYTKGLGEFFYKNKIDFRGLISYPYSNAAVASPAPFSRQVRALVGVGGGKDSIVAAELLKELNKPFTAFVVNSHPIMDQTIQLLGAEKLVVARTIDPLLIELNKQEDTYNGHVPVSAQNAFIALLTALLYDYKFIIMANEQSANFASTEYLGQEINHQWSKSYEFESLFQNYVKTYLTPDVYYFSLLRPFSEIAIVKLFSKQQKYFSVFSSCNKNFKITGEIAGVKWCGDCPKCAFTFAMLSAFLPKKELVIIFGQNLFAKFELIQLYKELLGVANIKPLDCVGTADEVRVAFYLASQRNEYEKDPVMQLFKKEVLPQVPDVEKLKEQVFKKSANHSIPDEFQEILSI